MGAVIIDGRAIAAAIDHETTVMLEEGRKGGRRACIGVVTVGSDPAAESYSRQKQRSAAKLGIDYKDIRLPAEEKGEGVLSAVLGIAHDDTVDAILVHTPLPRHCDERRILDSIPGEKDVDCSGTCSMGRMYSGRQLFAPATAEAVLEIMARSGLSPQGKNVVVLGRSLVIGKPLATLLMAKGNRGDATVTVCHSKTRDIGSHTREADIIVAAIGVPGYVTREMVAPGTAVIDVGINTLPAPDAKGGYRLVGDVDFDAVKGVASAITPVPGGVGPVTTAVLMRNVARAFRRELSTDN